MEVLIVKQLVGIQAGLRFADLLRFNKCIMLYFKLMIKAAGHSHIVMLDKVNIEV